MLRGGIGRPWHHVAMEVDAAIDNAFDGTATQEQVELLAAIAHSAARHAEESHAPETYGLMTLPELREVLMEGGRDA